MTDQPKLTRHDRLQCSYVPLTCEELAGASVIEAWAGMFLASTLAGVAGGGVMVSLPQAAKRAVDAAEALMNELMERGY